MASKYPPPTYPPPIHTDAGPYPPNQLQQSSSPSYYGPPQQYAAPGPYYNPPGPQQQGGMYYQQPSYPQGYQQGGYFADGRGYGGYGGGRSGAGEGICAAVMASLACCCCLDFLI